MPAEVVLATFYNFRPELVRSASPDAWTRATPDEIIAARVRGADAALRRVLPDAIGTSDTKDLADAYLAWFQMRARLMNAIFQWNVAAIRLDRATGEFHPRSPRP